MIRESFSKIKNRKAGQPPVILSEMVKITREAGIDMIIDQVSQIIGRVIPAKWELSTIVKGFKGKPVFWKKETKGDLN